MEKDLFDKMIKAYEMIEFIEDKFNNNKHLTLDELDSLFLFYQIENKKFILEDERFHYAKFCYFYLIYAFDLTFNSIYYKRNPYKKTWEYISFEKLKEINKKEYDLYSNNKIEDFRIANELIIPITDIEVQSDKVLLEEYAKYWANICLSERHSDEKWKTIAKETRDTLKKKYIESFLAGTLSKNDKSDIFKGLLKSYYVFFESIKIIERINLNEENTIFNLNGVNFEINHYSFIHILNRHFAEIASSQNISSSKSFHDTKINPYEIHLFVDNLISLIKHKDIEHQVQITKGNSILIKFHNQDYALCFDKYKYNKSKIILTTFFIIDSKNKSAKRFIEKIVISKTIELNNDLSIYIN